MAWGTEIEVPVTVPPVARVWTLPCPVEALPSPTMIEKRLMLDGVFCVPEAYLGRPGPRLVDGVRALRDVVATLGATRPG